MNHDGSTTVFGIGRARFGSTVRQVETFGQLEVELDRGCLVSTVERVRHGHVNLGSVKSAISGVDGPLARDELVERVRKRALCFFPRFELAEVLFRTCRKLELELKAKLAVHVLQKVEADGHLVFELFGHAEVMGVVLLEAANASQARKSSAQLVAVKDAKVGKSHGQFAVRAVAMRKHQAVPRAVHRLETKHFLLNFELEHVVGVVFPMT